MSEGGGRYELHLFVCTHDRGAGHPKGSCAQRESAELLSDLRGLAHDRGLKGRVRINAAGCLGGCARGVTAVAYPNERWFERFDRAAAEAVLPPAVEAGDGDAV